MCAGRSRRAASPRAIRKWVVNERVFRSALALALVLAPLAVACNLKANAECASLTSNSASGVTKCGTESCTAGTYCSNPSGNVCPNGCKSDDNCGQNQQCDLSKAQTDLGGNKVGQCVNEQVGEGSCTDAGGEASDAGDAGTFAPKDAESD